MLLQPFLETARRLLGRLVAPAVLVALAVRLTGQPGELVRERPLAELFPLRRHPVAAAGVLEVAVADKPVEIDGQRRRGDGEEAGELLGRRRVCEPLAGEPVHRLQHLFADLQRVELTHATSPWSRI